MPRLLKSEKNYKFYNEKLSTDEGNKLIPKAKGNIPKLAVLLGLLSPFYYDLYNLCKEGKNIEELAQKMNVENEQMRFYIDKLLRNGLVELVEN
ncbi:MAG: hypothetical protein ACTSU2_10850 [Promethearchaeota archaeon]